MKKLFLVLIFCCYSINCYGLSIKNSGSVTFYVECKPAKKKYIEVANKAIGAFIKQYKEKTIKSNLKQIRLCDKIILWARDQWPAGTYDLKQRIIYIRANKAPQHQYRLEYILHHEFSSILLKRSKRGSLVRRKFLKYSKTKYGLEKSNGWMEYVPSLLRQGFLTPYSKTHFENDFNVLAGYYKTPRIHKGMKSVFNFPLIVKKYSVIKNFYKNL